MKLLNKKKSKHMKKSVREKKRKIEICLVEI